MNYFLHKAALKFRRASSRYKLFSDEYHNAGGDSAALEDGRISYQWHGPENGEKIVLSHGFATPKFVWQNTIPSLVAAGYRVLSYDHFGRGQSDRPLVNYDRNFYVRELQQLLDSLNITEPVNLIGYSMGGGNVTSFAAEHPKRVKQLILLAPAGFVPPYSGLMKLLAMPFIGKWLLTLAGADSLLEELHKASSKGIFDAATLKDFEKQFYIKGTPHALTSTLNHYPMSELNEDYRKVGLHGVKVTAIWGDDDDIVPIAGAEKMKQVVPQLELKVVAGAKHDFAYTQADIVNPIILEKLG